MEVINVFDEIIKEHRMPVLFIGSGISKRYLYNYPNWEELLKTSFYKISNDPYLYQKYYDEYNRKGYNNFQIFKALGTAAESEFNKAFFELFSELLLLYLLQHSYHQIIQVSYFSFYFLLN